MIRKKKVTKQSVIGLVKKQLDAVGHGIKFEILEAGVRADGEWWYVPVVASRHGHDVPREVTINVFANVETELEDEHNLTVLFVPAVA